MPTFHSSHPPISVPWHLPVWDWLFESEYSPLRKHPASAIQGFTNAATNEHVSYSDLKTHATHLSTALVRDHGLREGDTVALFSPNTVWYPVAMLGVLRAGGVVSGASPAYNVEEMTYALRIAKARFLFTVPDSMAVAAAAARDAGIPRERVFLLEGRAKAKDDGFRFATMRDLLAQGRKQREQIAPFKLPPGKKSSDVCGFLSFSSGTTGLPKAVMIAHSNVIAQCLQMEQLKPPHLEPSEPRKVLAVLPLFHITGLVHQLHLPILLNARVFMTPTFTLPSTLQLVQDHRLEELLLVPPIIILLVRQPAEVLSRYDLSSIKRFSSGAAPLSPEVLALLEKKFPGTGFKQGYGMTESCSCITAHPPDRIGYRYAARVGTLVASTEVKIMDPDSGKECGVGEPGEVWARGPQIVMGYLDNPVATAATFDADGFLHTGDIGRMDDEGFLTITDRLKEMIKVKGIGVAPAELEDLLLGHPDVEDVACLGVPDAYAGERPKAYVVLRAGLEGQGEEEVARGLIRYVRDRKVRHKWLAEVEVVDQIPKSASGKILRRVLRDMARQGRKGLVVEAEGEKAKL